MKNLTVWMIAGCLAMAGTMPASAQPYQNGGDRRTGAYEIAIKCYVVAGNASAALEDANDPKAAAAFTAKARTAFETAKGIGKALGYSAEQIDADFDAGMAEELPRLRDAAYLRDAIAQCKAYRLL